MAALLGISAANAAEIYQGHRSGKQLDQFEENLDQIKLLLETNTSLATHDRQDLTAIRRHIEKVQAIAAEGNPALPDFFNPLAELLTEAVETQLDAMVEGNSAILEYEEKHFIQLPRIIESQNENIRNLLEPELSEIKGHLKSITLDLGEIKDSQKKTENYTADIPEIKNLLQQLAAAQGIGKTRDSVEDKAPQKPEPHITAHQTVAEENGLTEDQLHHAIQVELVRLEAIQSPSYDERYETILAHIALGKYKDALASADALISECDEKNYSKRNLADALLLKLKAAECLHLADLIVETSQRATGLFQLETEQALWLSTAEACAHSLLNFAQYEAAEPLIRQAIDYLEVRFGHDRPIIFPWLSLLGAMLYDTSNLEGAKVIGRRLVKSTQAHNTSKLTFLSEGLNLWGLALVGLGNHAEAEPLMRRALAIHEASFGEHHPYVATELNNLAYLLHRNNRMDEAEPLMRRHVVIFLLFTKRTDHEHPHLRAALGNYKELLQEMKTEEPVLIKKLVTLGTEADWPEDKWRGFLREIFGG